MKNILVKLLKLFVVYVIVAVVLGYTFGLGMGMLVVNGVITMAQFGIYAPMLNSLIQLVFIWIGIYTIIKELLKK